MAEPAKVSAATTEPQPAMPEAQRKLIWESLLQADIHTRYFGHLAERNARRERWITWSIAVLSSGSVAGIVGDKKVLATTLGLSVAVLSVTLNVLKFGNAAQLSASLQKKWGAISTDLEDLWARVESYAIDADTAMVRWRKTQDAVAALDEQASSRLSSDQRLVDSSYIEALTARRLITG